MQKEYVSVFVRCICFVVMFCFQLSTLLQAGPVLSSAPALVPSKEGAQRFVDAMLDDATAALEQEEVAQREGLFLTMLENNFDHKGMARYMLGSFYNDLSDAQRDHYLALLKKYMVRLYLSKFDSYGEKLPRDSFKIGRVFALRPDNPKSQWIVKTIMRIRQEGRQVEIDIDWRLYPGSSGWRVLDVFIEGVSLSQTKREEFVASAQRDGIEIFLKTLEEQAS